MSILTEASDLPVDSVLHPTDLSQASLMAFHHALAIAIHRGAQFTLLHATGGRSTDSWADFPGVRDTLARWRAAGTTASLEEKIRRTSVSKIDVDVRDPVAACERYIDRHAVDMLVLATAGRSGIPRLVRPSLAEKLARRSRLFTLFVPTGGRPFVSGDTGEVTLRRILIPMDPATDPRPAMLRAVRSAALLDDRSLEITLLHVGDGEETSVPDVPQLPFCKWNAVRKSGDVTEQILGVAEDITADAIYMSTSWRKPGLGRAAGGVTEAVLAGALCPVATIPIDAD